MLGLRKERLMSDEDLTVTFKRDAAEHVAVMQGFGKRLVARENARSRVVDALVWAALGVAIFAFFNVVFLPAFDQGLSPSQARLLITVCFVLLVAFFLLLVSTVFYMMRYKRVLMRRLSAPEEIEIRADKRGIEANTRFSRTFFDWRDIRAISRLAGRLEIELDGYVVYIPVRAFADEAQMKAAGERLKALRIAATADG